MKFKANLFVCLFLWTFFCFFWGGSYKKNRVEFESLIISNHKKKILKFFPECLGERVEFYRISL